MNRTLRACVAAAATLSLAACSTAAAPTTSPTGAVQSAPGGVSASGSTTGAGGGGGGGGGSSVTDPCTLLTQAEVTSVVGKPVGPGSSADNPNSCDFQYPAEGVPDIQAGVDFIDGTLDDVCSDVAGASAMGMTIEPISGLGDGACFIYVGKLRAGSTLTFSRNGRLFQTFADLGPSSSTADMKAADTTLAQDALARL
jgi:hypothetical protein